MKSYYQLALGLFAIMLVATIVVVGFNYLFGLNTNVSDDNVATAIAVIAFAIALVLRFVYFRDE
jgi:ABC-type Mn2+/Zn2+ transport system permease subunit